MKEETNESKEGPGCMAVVLAVAAGIIMVPIAPFVIAYLILKDVSDEM